MPLKIRMLEHKRNQIVDARTFVKENCRNFSRKSDRNTLSRNGCIRSESLQWAPYKTAGRGRKGVLFAFFTNFFSSYTHHDRRACTCVKLGCSPKTRSISPGQRQNPNPGPSLTLPKMRRKPQTCMPRNSLPMKISGRKIRFPALSLDGDDNTDEIIQAMGEYKSKHSKEDTEEAVHDWFDRYDSILASSARQNAHTLKQRSFRPITMTIGIARIFRITRIAYYDGDRTCSINMMLN